MKDMRRVASATLILSLFGTGCLSFREKADAPLLKGGPGENMHRLTALMKSPAAQRQAAAPSSAPPAPSRPPAPSQPPVPPQPGRGSVGGSMERMLALMKTPAGKDHAAVPVGGDDGSSPAGTSRPAPLPERGTEPATAASVEAAAAAPAAPVPGREAAPATAATAPPQVPPPGTVPPAAPPIATTASPSPAPEPAPVVSFRPRAATSTPDRAYRLGPEDVIRVSVWDNRDLTTDVTVRPDGKISLPLVNDVEAAGLTPPELAQALSGKMHDFIKDPHVTVIVTQVVAPRVYLIGKVLRPGHYPLRQEMTVLQALALAGGFTTFASVHDIKVLRDTAGGQDIRRIDFDRVTGESGEDNVILRAGDTIVVP